MTHSILTNVTPYPPFTATDTNAYTEHIIRGDLLQASFEQTEHISSWLPTKTVDEVKELLCSLLVQEMMKSNHITFTKSQNPYDNVTRYHARIFVTPSEMTQFVRSLQKNYK